MKKITVLVLMFAFNSAFAKPALQAALTAALEKAETDSAESKVTIELESDARVAAWHESDEKIVALDGTSLVDVQDTTPNNYVPGNTTNVQALEAAHSEVSIKEELSDI